MADSSTKHLFCPRCGYDLSGLESSRCPECGADFDRLALERERTQPSITIAGAIGRTLWVPAVSMGVGLLFGRLIDTQDDSGAQVAFTVCGFLALGLAAAAIYNSRRLARAFAISRGNRLGIQPFGEQNRSFLLLSGLGLFCCQGILSAAGFFGGCACVVLSNLRLEAH